MWCLMSILEKWITLKNPSQVTFNFPVSCNICIIIVVILFSSNMFGTYIT